MWNKTLELNGKKFGLLGWAKDVQLTLTAEQINQAGDDLDEILDWFKQHNREIGLVECWRESGYDHQYFEVEELAEILASSFASDKDKEYVRNRSLRRYEQEQVTPKKKKDPSGYVYLLHSNGVYKIGKAKKLDDRISAISPIMPHPVELVHSFHCDNCTDAELTLHERYAHKRLNGEWFELDEKDVSEIKSL